MQKNKDQQDVQAGLQSPVQSGAGQLPDVLSLRRFSPEWRAALDENGVKVTLDGSGGFSAQIDGRAVGARTFEDMVAAVSENVKAPKTMVFADYVSGPRNGSAYWALAEGTYEGGLYRAGKFMENQPPFSAEARTFKELVERLSAAADKAVREGLPEQHPYGVLLQLRLFVDVKPKQGG
jgi:hypothetical protein